MKNAAKRVFACKDQRRYSRKRAKFCRNFAKIGNYPTGPPATARGGRPPVRAVGSPAVASLGKISKSRIYVDDEINVRENVANLKREEGIASQDLKLFSALKNLSSIYACRRCARRSGTWTTHESDAALVANVRRSSFLDKGNLVLFSSFVFHIDVLRTKYSS